MCYSEVVASGFESCNHILTFHEVYCNVRKDTGAICKPGEHHLTKVEMLCLSCAAAKQEEEDKKEEEERKEDEKAEKLMALATMRKIEGIDYATIKAWQDEFLDQGVRGWLNERLIEELTMEKKTELLRFDNLIKKWIVKGSKNPPVGDAFEEWIGSRKEWKEGKLAMMSKFVKLVVARLKEMHNEEIHEREEKMREGKTTTDGPQSFNWADEVVEEEEMEAERKVVRILAVLKESGGGEKVGVAELEGRIGEESKKGFFNQKVVEKLGKELEEMKAEVEKAKKAEKAKKKKERQKANKKAEKEKKEQEKSEGVQALADTVEVLSLEEAKGNEDTKA